MKLWLVKIKSLEIVVFLFLGGGNLKGWVRMKWYEWKIVNVGRYIGFVGKWEEVVIRED